MRRAFLILELAPVLFYSHLHILIFIPIVFLIATVVLLFVIIIITIIIIIIIIVKLVGFDFACVKKWRNFKLSTFIFLFTFSQSVENL